MKRSIITCALALSVLGTLGVAEAQNINPKNGLPQEVTGPGPQAVPEGTGMFCSTDTPLAVPDNTPGGVDSSVNVAGSFVLTDLNVSLAVAHTWVGDLIFALSGPCGPLVIADRAGVPASTFGCSGNDIDATIDDEAATSYEDECGVGVPTITGSFIGGDPANASLMAACDGQNINGVWTLNVSDNAGGDTGTLNQWCLVTTPVPVELTEFAID